LIRRQGFSAVEFMASLRKAVANGLVPATLGDAEKASCELEPVLSCLTAMFSWLKSKHGPPGPADAMKRAIILKYLVVKELATPPPEFIAERMKDWGQKDRNEFLAAFQTQSTALIAQLRKCGLWDLVEKGERDFIEAGPTALSKQRLVDVAWLAESAVCLLWALGYVSELPGYDQEANVETVKMLPVEPVNVLIKNATLRPVDTTMKQRDLAELWHWRARTRQMQEQGKTPTDLPGGLTIEKIVQMTAAKAAENGTFPAPIGGDFPAFGKPYRDLNAEEFSRATSIAMERHRAFNWLCGYAPGNSWAETPTDT